MNKQQYILREFYKMCDGGVCTDRLTTEEKFQVKEHGVVYLTGIAQRAEAKNGNGRIYPFNTLAREVENYKRVIYEKRACGQLDHPENSVIELEKASHLITDIWMEDNDVWVKLRLLGTPAGNIAKTLVKEGVQLGLSSRGLGSVSEQRDGTLLVEDDFQLICFDLVSDPSTQGAFMKPMPLMESTKRNLPVFSREYQILRRINDILQVNNE